MNRYDNVRSRWRQSWKDNLSLNRLGAGLNVALAGAVKLTGKAQDIQGSDRLSPKGVRDEVRDFARREVVPDVRRAVFEIDRERAEIAERRRTMTLKGTDPADVAAAILRTEMRTWLRSLTASEKASVLLAEDADPTLHAAVFEVPAAMIGIPSDLRDRIQTARFEKTHGPELEALEDREEAVKVVEAGVALALYDIRQTGDFESDGVFDEWMREASINIDAELRSKVA